jgi:hypothetical protein
LILARRAWRFLRVKSTGSATRSAHVGLESEQTLVEFGQRTKVVGGKSFSLNDREVELSIWLSQLAWIGVWTRMAFGHLERKRSTAFSPRWAEQLSTIQKTRWAVLVRRLAHNLTNQVIDRSNAVFDFAAAEDFGATYVPRCQVGPGALAKVLVLDSHGASGSRRQSRLFAASGLNTGLLISRDHEVIGAQRGALPNALIQVKDTTSLGRKVGVARENPASMLPRAQGITAEPAPQGSTADLRDQPLSNSVLADLSDREPRQGQSEAVRQFTGERLNLNYEAGGKSGREPPSWLLIETGETILVEAFSLLAHNLARRIQACSDAIVGQTLRRQQHDLGPQHITIWWRIFPRPGL